VSYVFVLDIEMNSQNILMFEELSHKFSVFYIDHHPSDFLPKITNLIKTESADCTTLTVYRLAKHILDEKFWSWLLCAVAFSEFSYKKESNLEFIKKYYPRFD
jgi:hypothetical protein